MFLEWHPLLRLLRNMVLCHPNREPRADFISVPTLRAWEEVTVTSEPENSAKKLGVMRIYPASLWNSTDASQTLYICQKGTTVPYCYGPCWLLLRFIGTRLALCCLLPCFGGFHSTFSYHEGYHSVPAQRSLGRF